jgi:hypothetical protein
MFACEEVCDSFANNAMFAGTRKRPTNPILASLVSLAAGVFRSPNFFRTQVVVRSEQWWGVSLRIGSSQGEPCGSVVRWRVFTCRRSIVSGRPKPATDGRVKTSHLRQRRNCHAPFSSPLAKGANTWQTYSKWLQSLTSLHCGNSALFARKIGARMVITAGSVFSGEAAGGRRSRGRVRDGIITLQCCIRAGGRVGTRVNGVGSVDYGRWPNGSFFAPFPGALPLAMLREAFGQTRPAGAVAGGWGGALECCG